MALQRPADFQRRIKRNHAFTVSHNLPGPASGERVIPPMGKNPVAPAPSFLPAEQAG